MSLPRSPIDVEALRREAQPIDDCIRAIVARGKQDHVTLAYALAEMNRRRRWSVYGCADLVAYAALREVDLDPSKVRQMVRMVQVLQTEDARPLRELFETGEVGWTKVREASRQVGKIPVEQLVEDVKTLPFHALRRKLRRQVGEPNTTTFVVELDDEQLAIVEAALRSERERDPTATTAQALTRAVHGKGSGTKPQLVLHREPSGVTTIETQHGPVEASPALVARVECDHEEIDLRQEPPKVSKKIPRAIERLVRKRDRDRCVVRGCTNQGFVEVHHVGGRDQVGHDPRCMACLCVGHHTSHHEGTLPIVVEEEHFHFFDAAGRSLGRAPRGTRVP